MQHKTIPGTLKVIPETSNKYYPNASEVTL